MRNSDGTFAKGNGGRKKGSKNKTTTQLRQMLHDLLSDNMDTIQSDLDKLEPYERLRIFTQWIAHVLPKPKPVDTVTTIDSTDWGFDTAKQIKPIKWTDEE